MLEDEYLARPASEALARAIQGAELIRHSTGEVIDGFMATRLVRPPALGHAVRHDGAGDAQGAGRPHRRPCAGRALAVRAQMVAKGWLAEVDGPNLVAMCAPQ